MKRTKKSPAKKDQALWGGRFQVPTSEIVLEYSQSVSYDSRLYRYDIWGSLAHARMLKKVGILTVEELADIEKHLHAILKDIEEGRFSWNLEMEDVHMNIEAELTRRTPAGAKLHTGRSRNDQVATDARLWLRYEIFKDTEALRKMLLALVELAEKNKDVVIPGYTHLQRAQPVLLAHHLLAYVEMFHRDAQRLLGVLERANECPLGSGAIAGSTLPLDREATSKFLRFDCPTRNSMDAVSDRDFFVEYAFVGALMAAHLSRLAEDLILWSSAEFGYICIGDAFTTGSSLMPQKKNPDVAELMRGKSARVIGNLVSLLTLLKGLPMTYNRDLQEDKERVFDTADTIFSTLEVIATMLPDIAVNREKCLAAASDPALLATDAADWLVLKGIPFREAHEIVGKAVALAELKNKPLNALNDVDWKSLDKRIKPGITEVFDLKRSLAKREFIGATGPKQVAGQIVFWKKQLKRSA